MIGTVLTAFRAIKAAREWLILLAVAAVAAWLWAQYAGMRRQVERDHAWGDRICAAAGVNARAPGYVAGSCTDRIMRLAALERDTLTVNNAALAKGFAEATAKTKADGNAFAAAAADARAAADMMERANAHVGPDDRVGRDWFVALNHAGGLH